MDVKYSDKFIRSAARLPPKIRILADEKESLFKQRPFHPSLETHKLHGKDKNLWGFSINQKYRIKFAFIASGTAFFLDIGDHSIYK